MVTLVGSQSNEQESLYFLIVGYKILEVDLILDFKLQAPKCGYVARYNYKEACVSKYALNYSRNLDI